MTPEGIERIWARVERLYRSGFLSGDRAVCAPPGRGRARSGHRHAAATGRQTARTRSACRPPGTPFPVFSASKVMTTVVVHLLEERGLLHVGDRVCEYIPSTPARQGRHYDRAAALPPRGCAQLPADAFDLERLVTGSSCWRCCAPPSPLAAGKLLSYHAVSGGFILAEIVRRVTGRNIRTVLGRRSRAASLSLGNYGVGAGRAAGRPQLPTGPRRCRRCPPCWSALSASTGRVTVLSNDRAS